MRRRNGADSTFMVILDDHTAMAVLTAVYEAASGCSGVAIRQADLTRYTPIEPAATADAIARLLEAGLLARSGGSDRSMLTRAGLSCLRSYSGKMGW